MASSRLSWRQEKTEKELMMPGDVIKGCNGADGALDDALYELADWS
jgi:hypothetical protein